MFLFFFCPTSVYQQSFLGEQTTPSTPTRPQEQPWSQRESIKLAIFEFDFFKNPVRSGSSQDETDGVSDSRTDIRSGEIDFNNKNVVNF